MKYIAFSFFLILSFQACSQTTKKNNNDSIRLSKMEKLPQTEAEWKAKLSSEEFYILRQKGTERPYTGKFLMHNEKGVYTCKGCGAPLFASDAKFDSHCGWPSFDKEIKRVSSKKRLTIPLECVELKLLVANVEVI